MTLPLPFELESIISDVERCIEAKLYYPAILITLTLPEICSALALENSEFIKKPHYVEFIEKYAPVFDRTKLDQPALGLDGVACYQIRGGIVHRANMAGHADFSASHVLFVPPKQAAKVHSVMLKIAGTGKSALVLDLREFCSAMQIAVSNWYTDNHEKPLVSENLKNLIRGCPNGLHPFVHGMPVVASGPAMPPKEGPGGSVIAVG